MADAILEQISENLIKGRAPQVKELVQQALDKKVPVADILNKGLVAGMGVIGERFKRNEVYVPEVLIAARAMSAGMSILKPKLVEAGVKAKGIVCVGTVKGDLHDIGKNLVCMMLEGAGYQVVDLGVNVDTEKFVKAAQAKKLAVVDALIVGVAQGVAICPGISRSGMTITAGILRKLDTLDSIYQKIHDHASTQRMEVLEWIIIVLIAFSMVMPFVGLGAK